MSDDNSGEVLAKLIVGGMLVAGAVAVTGKVIRSLSNKEESDLTDRVEPTSKPVIVEIQEKREYDTLPLCLYCHELYIVADGCDRYGNNNRFCSDECCDQYYD